MSIGVTRTYSLQPRSCTARSSRSDAISPSERALLLAEEPVHIVAL